eukprot:gene16888-23163_t
MGAGVSRPSPPPEVDTSGLAFPYSKGEQGDMCYFVMPHDEELKKKGDTLILEVGRLGLRLLRNTDSEQPIAQYPWGQIHSWAHTTGRFTFRHFDDGKKTIIPYILYLRDVQAMLDHIANTIELILNERKEQAIGDEAFENLLEQLKHGDPNSKLQQLETIEAAVLLHGRLIDQNHFSLMLQVLDGQADRDNCHGRNHSPDSMQPDGAGGARWLSRQGPRVAQESALTNSAGAARWLSIQTQRIADNCPLPVLLELQDGYRKQTVTKNGKGLSLNNDAGAVDLEDGTESPFTNGTSQGSIDLC